MYKQITDISDVIEVNEADQFAAVRDIYMRYPGVFDEVPFHYAEQGDDLTDLMTMIRTSIENGWVYTKDWRRN